MIGSLFSGIGLLDLGLERAGLGSPAWQVELDPFCRSVLARHWPSTERFDDVRSFTPPATSVPVVCGGFPCQPYSVAGNRKGNDDERALWPHFARIVEQAKPAIVVGENVPGLRTLALRGVLADLAALGFDVEWTCFSAGSLGAPHKRDRLWIVAAHPDRCAIRQRSGWLSRAVGAALETQSRRDREVLDPDALRARREGTGADDTPQRKWARSADGRTLVAPHANGDGRVESAIRVATERGWTRHCGWSLDPSPRVDDGRAGKLDRAARGVARARRRALGNGVVVACAELVGRAIVEALA